MVARTSILTTLLALLIVGALLAAPRAASATPPKGAKVTLDFNEVKLKDMVFLFSQLTEQNFVLLAKDLENKTVTVIAPRPVSIDEACDIFVAALHMHGLAVERQGDFYLIQPIR